MHIMKAHLEKAFTFLATMSAVDEQQAKVVGARKTGLAFVPAVHEFASRTRWCQRGRGNRQLGDWSAAGHGRGLAGALRLGRQGRPPRAPVLPDCEDLGRIYRRPPADQTAQLGCSVRVAARADARLEHGQLSEAQSGKMGPAPGRFELGI